MGQKTHFIAYAELTLSMIFLGSTFVMGKNLITVFPIFLLLGVRFLIGTVCFSVAYCFNKVKIKEFENTLTKKDWFLLFLQSLFGAFLFNFFILLGLKFTSANAAAILTSTIPAFITVFSYLILREYISRYKSIAIALSIAGLILVTVDPAHFVSNSINLWGNLLIFLAVISGSLFPICIKLLSNKVPTLFISFTFNLFGLLLFLPISISDAVHFNFRLISMFTWLLVIFYGVTANVLYLNFWNKGLSVVPASTASLFVAVMPISTGILAYIFLNEMLTVLQIGGIVCVTAAIIFGVYKT